MQIQRVPNQCLSFLPNNSNLHLFALRRARCVWTEDASALRRVLRSSRNEQIQVYRLKRAVNKWNGFENGTLQNPNPTQLMSTKSSLHSIIEWFVILPVKTKSNIKRTE